MQSNEVNSLNRQISRVLLTGYLLVGYLTTTPFYEGYQIAKALRARRSKRFTKKSDLPASNPVGIHESSNSHRPRTSSYIFSPSDNLHPINFTPPIISTPPTTSRLLRTRRGATPAHSTRIRMSTQVQMTDTTNMEGGFLINLCK